MALPKMCHFQQVLSAPASRLEHTRHGHVETLWKEEGQLGSKAPGSHTGNGLASKCQPERGLGVLESGLLLLSWSSMGDVGSSRRKARVMASQCGALNVPQLCRRSTCPEGLPGPHNCPLVQSPSLSVPLRVALGAARASSRCPSPRVGRQVPLSMGRSSKAPTREEMPLRGIQAAKGPAESVRTGAWVTGEEDRE